MTMPVNKDILFLIYYFFKNISVHLVPSNVVKRFFLLISNNANKLTDLIKSICPQKERWDVAEWN